MRAAVAGLAAHLGAHLGPYLVEPGCNPIEPGCNPIELLAAAQRLCAAPALRALPHLTEPKTLAVPQAAAAAATAAAATLEPEDVAAVRAATVGTRGFNRRCPACNRMYSTQVELSVRGLALLPAALTSADARLPWLPTPLLLALYVGHAAAAAAAAAAGGAAGAAPSAPSAPRAAALAGLADAATAAVRALAALVPAQLPAGAALLESAASTALALSGATPAAARLPPLSMAMALLGALPEASRGAEVHRAAQQALRGLLGSAEVAAQRVGLQALQSLLQAAAAPAAPPAAAACGHAYTCALAPDVAPLLLRATAPAATDKAAAVKVLLLAC